MAGRGPVDQRVDLVAVTNDRADEFASQLRRDGIAFDLGQMALEDRLGGALAEVSFEDRGQRKPTSGTSSPLPVSLRHHRR
ncbi:MAG TPA: hypothetical protein VFM38_13800 [Candidatus Limnocylindrales bacterium]|nr:hypothetical protein [Candidatus Limnocylindrales bacterium]